jgi:nitronate monooxygenase
MPRKEATMLATALTRLFGLRHPIVLAPMGSVAGGRLAAAVTNAGALGIVGGGYGDARWVRRELDVAREHARGPWGIGFITWSIDPDVFALALRYRPAAVFLSFGDPRPHAPAIRAAGCRLVCQVQDVASARLAQEAGADVIVAQGSEAGGHGGSRATLPLVPAVVDIVSPTPVVAAGGIADGRGLAAALALGAQGALIGTRFFAASESLGPEWAKRRLVEAHAERTARTRVFDVVRGYAWPEPYTGRALRNRFMDAWHGREHDLDVALATEQPAYRAATADGSENEYTVVWAGEGVDLIDRIDDAATLVARIASEAEAQLRSAAALIR